MEDRTYADSDVAVIGMSIKVAGADDLDEFWQLMNDNQSQHVEVPADRFTFDTEWRKSNPQTKWYGNFIRDIDGFDHRFFKKSPREMESTDPQQRLFLQSAYQTVAQAGYFDKPDPDLLIGVYVGAGSAEYEYNTACYEPNSFGATGTLKSSIAGRVSHYFGWTGPSIAIDTACSSSAVAVHMACQAILQGECVAAVAGGTGVLASPLFYQNLKAASFLSPTGPCKPFDKAADGYCRGEGVASVFLKRASDAVRDNDHILAYIAGTAVAQNDNNTPMFAPGADSLANLFRLVVRRSNISPRDISYVEAHGVGTRVGDPAEYEAIRRVFDVEALRTNVLPVSSVKGLVGHTECAAGAVSLVKTLLVMHRGDIPAQASFQELSPALGASPSDMLEIPTRRRQWDSRFRAALVNSFGASGSNAAMIVTRDRCAKRQISSTLLDGTIDHPFCISGLDDRSIQRYAAKLASFVNSNHVTVADVSYNLRRQSNPALPKRAVFTASSRLDLLSQLSDLAAGPVDAESGSTDADRKVILCFGGQISKIIGLDLPAYDSISLLRKHLDECNHILMAKGQDSMYPQIFDKAVVDDPVRLQTMLFAIQYACAKVWIACGVKVAAVVGHSFGELTCLAIAQVLPLRDVLGAVIERANLIKAAWSSDRGAMVSIEGPRDDTESLVQQVNSMSDGSASIACYNGPDSVTLAGTVSAMEQALEELHGFNRLRGKAIPVSNAFHSILVDPLMDKMKRIGENMAFATPAIPWYRATRQAQDAPITSDFFARHMRDPVFADSAFRRLHADFPSAIWLEAGSRSTITAMARRALGDPLSSSFREVDVTSHASSSLSKLACLTAALWRDGLSVSHWPHHRSQTHEYAHLLLPPYQFESCKHWLPVKESQNGATPSSSIASSQGSRRNELSKFLGWVDKPSRHARYEIQTSARPFQDMVHGHAFLKTPVSPASLVVSIAYNALYELNPEYDLRGVHAAVHLVKYQAPILLGSRVLHLDLEQTTGPSNTIVWTWTVSSTVAAPGSRLLHATGQFVLRGIQDKHAASEFIRYERLVGHKRCVELLNSTDAEDVVQGRSLYRVFSEIVEYAAPYRGLRKVVGKDAQSAGRVNLKRTTDAAEIDPYLSDCFGQVAGLWINCMTDRPESEVFIASGFEAWLRSTPVPSDDVEVWDVFAMHHKESDSAWRSDVFVFEAATGRLTEMILGVTFTRISKASMHGLFGRSGTHPSSTQLSWTDGRASDTSAATLHPLPAPTSAIPDTVVDSQAARLPHQEEHSQSVATPTVEAVVRSILATLTSLDEADILPDLSLADIGIDSLVSMQLAHDLEVRFSCRLSNLVSWADIDSVADVVARVREALDARTPAF